MSGTNRANHGVPWDVHISDPNFYEILFNTNTPYNKTEKLRYRFWMYLSSFDTIDHDNIKRRSAIFAFFAWEKLVSFSPQIQEKAMAGLYISLATVLFGGGGGS